MAGVTLVTGATGFIGAHVVRQLVARGERVRALARRPGRLADVGLEAGGPLEVARGDLLEPASLAPALAGVARVYHIAGLVSTDRRERDRVHRLNVDATRNLLAAARAAAVERIVYLASIFALGGGAAEPRAVDEGTAYTLGALGVDYAEAKRRAELLVRDACANGLPVVFAYPCFCYGPGDVNGSSSRLIELHLRRLLWVALPGGQNAMDVRDAAAGLVLAMDHGREGERYLLGGENRSNRELADLLASITGLAAPFAAVPGIALEGLGRLAGQLSRRAPIDAQAARLATRYWYYDDRKARRELGHRSRPLAETFGDAIRWLCETGRAPWPPRLR